MQKVKKFIMKIVSKVNEMSKKEKIILASTLVGMFIIITIVINFKSIETSFYSITKNYNKLLQRIDYDIEKINDSKTSENKKNKIINKTSIVIDKVVKSNDEGLVKQVLKKIENQKELLFSKTLVSLNDNNFIVKKSIPFISKINSLEYDLTKEEMKKYVEYYLTNIEVSEETDSTEEIVQVYLDEYFNNIDLEESFTAFLKNKKTNEYYETVKTTIKKRMDKDTNPEYIKRLFAFFENDEELYQLDYNAKDFLVRFDTLNDMLKDETVKGILSHSVDISAAVSNFYSTKKLEANVLKEFTTYFVEEKLGEEELNNNILEMLNTINDKKSLVTDKVTSLRELEKEKDSIISSIDGKVASIDSEISSAESSISSTHKKINELQDELDSKKSYFGAHVYIVGKYSGTDEYEGAKSYWNSILQMEIPLKEERCIIIPTKTTFTNKGVYDLKVYQIGERNVTLKDEFGGFEQTWPVFKEVSNEDYRRIKEIESEIPSLKVEVKSYQSKVTTLSNKRKEAKSSKELTDIQNKINILRNDINGEQKIIDDTLLKLKSVTSNELIITDEDKYTNLIGGVSSNEVSTNKKNSEEIILGQWKGNSNLTITKDKFGGSPYKVLSSNEKNVDIEIRDKDGVKIKYRLTLVSEDKIMQYFYNEVTASYTGGAELNRIK